MVANCNDDIPNQNRQDHLAAENSDVHRQALQEKSGPQLPRSSEHRLPLPIWLGNAYILVDEGHIPLTTSILSERLG
jgi:hypothetical protein